VLPRKKKVVYLHNEELFSHKTLAFAAKWMELEDIMLSEINQTQKDKYTCSLS
jgi:hypothetical protein